MRFPVFDLHCDTAFEMLGKDFDAPCSLRRNKLHIDLDRARKFPGFAQCFACFTSDENALSLPVSPKTLFELEYRGIVDAIQENNDMIAQAFCVNDIEANYKAGKMSAVLSIEGPAGFGFDPEQLEDLYAKGFRITTLGWNEKNPLTGSHITGGGLTDLGRRYVTRAQQLGMIVDVSHISDEAFWDIMAITAAPVIASHSNSRSVWNVSRNITDDMFGAVCETGGVVGINLYAYFLGESPDLNTVCDHIIHFLSMDPNGKHIALGGDLDGCDVLPAGFAGVEDYPKLAECMLRRNISEQTVRDIFWNNVMGVMKRCCI